MCYVYEYTSVFQVHLASRQIPLHSYREIYVINAGRKKYFHKVKVIRVRTTRFFYLLDYKRQLRRGIDLHCQHNSPTTHIEHVPYETSGFHPTLGLQKYQARTDNGTTQTQSEAKELPLRCLSTCSVSNISQLYILVRPIFNCYFKITLVGCSLYPEITNTGRQCDNTNRRKWASSIVLYTSIWVSLYLSVSNLE